MVKKVKTPKKTKVKKRIIDETPGVAMNRVIAATRQHLVAHKVLFWAMFGVVILLAWFFVFRYPVIQEKRQFDKAETLLLQYNKRITKGVDITNSQIVKKCSYASVKYENGTEKPRCSIRINSEISDLTVVSINRLSRQASDILHIDYTSGDNFTMAQINNPDFLYYKEFIMEDSMKCNYGIYKNHNSPIFTIGCYKNIPFEIYPIIE